MLAIENKEKGSVLVAVLIISVILLILGSIFGYKIISATKTESIKLSKDKTYYLAARGIEDARVYLSDNYISTNYWSSLLSVNGTYSKINSLSFAQDNINVEVYVKDNEDWDGNPSVDNDLKIYILSIATDQKGTKTVIESLVFYDASVNPYAQKGMGPKKTGYSNTGGISNLGNINPVSFQLGGQ